MDRNSTSTGLWRPMVAGLVIVCGLATGGVRADEPSAARLAAARFERAVLDWIEVEGTTREGEAYEQMAVARKSLVAVGPAALEEIGLLLEHEQSNVRRGSAIALLAIVDAHKLKSQLLLDKILLRMVEDPDLKTRHNLYHVSRKLIAHMRDADRNIAQETFPARN